MFNYALIGYCVLLYRLSFEKGFAERQSSSLNIQILTIVLGMTFWPLTVISKILFFRKSS